MHTTYNRTHTRGPSRLSVNSPRNTSLKSRLPKLQKIEPKTCANDAGIAGHLSQMNRPKAQSIFWISENNACEGCNSLDLQEAKFDSYPGKGQAGEPYWILKGKRVNFPLHPNCKCTLAKRPKHQGIKNQDRVKLFAEVALKKEGSLRWNKKGDGETGNEKWLNQPKCNLFVDQIAAVAGIKIPKRYLVTPVPAVYWANPENAINHWDIIDINKVRPGDIIAWYITKKDGKTIAHVGIVVEKDGKHLVASSSTADGIEQPGIIVVNNWGVSAKRRKDEGGTWTARRYNYKGEQSKPTKTNFKLSPVN